MERKLLLVGVLAILSMFILSYIGFTGYAVVDKPLAEEYGCPECNVILISIDALRADHLGVYGYYQNTTPNIDEFAENAIVFEDNVAQAPWTLPSHMSILTGLYPAHHGVQRKTQKLSNSIITLADILYNSSYETGAFTGGGYVSKEYNYHGFEKFSDNGGQFWRNFGGMLEWIKKNSDKRFFLFWHTFKTHMPYTTLKEFDVFSDKNYSGIVNVYPSKEDPICNEIKNKTNKEDCLKRRWPYWKRIIDNLTEEDLDYIKAKYDGEIYEMDYKFSIFIDFLERNGLLNKTVIVFTSDHGEQFAEREIKKRIGHNQLYETVLHVPLIIKIPGYNEQVKVEGITESIDIMPTILEILGIYVPNRLDGNSLLDRIGEEKKEDFGFSSNRIRGNIQGNDYSIKEDDFRLSYRKRKKGGFELYNLKEDLFEKNNLFGKNLSIEKKLVKKLLEMRSMKTEYNEKIDSLDDKTLKQLKALGYI